MFNKNIITILLVTFCLVIFVFQHVQNLNKRVKMLESNKEKFTSITQEIREEIMNAVDRTYNMDTEAIRNLGAISKSILTGKNYHNLDGNVTPGKLVIPANVEIEGELTVRKRLEVNSGEFYNTEAGTTYTNDSGIHTIASKYVGQIKPKEAIIIEVDPNRVPKIRSHNPEKNLHINTYGTARASLFLNGGTYAQLPYNSLEMFSNKIRIQNELTIRGKYHPKTGLDAVTYHQNYEDGPDLEKEKIVISAWDNQVPKIESFHSAKEFKISTKDSSAAAVRLNQYGNPYNTIDITQSKTEINRPLSILTNDSSITLRTMLGHNYYKGSTYKYLDKSNPITYQNSTLPVGFVIQNTEVSGGSDNLDDSSKITSIPNNRPDLYSSPEQMEYTHKSINFISAPLEGQNRIDCLTRVIRTGIAISMPKDTESTSGTLGGWGNRQYMKIGHIDHFNGDMPDRMSPFGIQLKRMRREQGENMVLLLKQMIQTILAREIVEDILHFKEERFPLITKTLLVPINTQLKYLTYY